ncbi:DUF6776 family protein [Pseudoxanthomonas dokdonensis]|uniref:Transmembrane protein n=1 Tax=Pseudoxanthomonas dokdonensis TaxID=344882 RepID=A0A0R0CZI4_9GAMM|nr:DUF6776 family protein [Pseudoxanthomonas dokdonensis]KRG71598.1 hypothetical protein ABB29_02215 [Pseudoxanthomonas dokdonensis]
MDQPRAASAFATRMWLIAAIVVMSVCLIFGAWGAWQVMASGDAPSAAQLHSERQQLEQLQQRNATLSRSDQISRDANADLQRTLAERDEEIAGLRADVAFYERFVGSTAQRHGLAVHELVLSAQAENAWHFRATLTQNINRGAVNAGRLVLIVEGTRDGKLQRLDWSQLRQQDSAPGVAYSFKYFQELEGDLFLPAGFQPVRVIARLVPQNGDSVEQSFTWADATGKDGAVAPPA